MLEAVNMKPDEPKSGAEDFIDCDVHLTGYERSELAKENPDYKALYQFKAKRCDNLARRISYIHACGNGTCRFNMQTLKLMAYGRFTRGD